LDECISERSPWLLPEFRVVLERDGGEGAVGHLVVEAVQFLAAGQGAVQLLHDGVHHTAVGRIADEDELSRPINS